MLICCFHLRFGTNTIAFTQISHVYACVSAHVVQNKPFPPRWRPRFRFTNKMRVEGIPLIVYSNTTIKRLLTIKQKQTNQPTLNWQRALRARAATPATLDV
jgi:hypothetical protein